jgi:hypothetical protein
MARGDVASDWYVSLAGGATVDIQPGSGVEQILFGFGSADNGSGNVRGNDGTATDALYIGEFGDTAGMAANLRNIAIAGIYHTQYIQITNGEYFRLENTGAGTVTYTYKSVETK